MVSSSVPFFRFMPWSSLLWWNLYLPKLLFVIAWSQHQKANYNPLDLVYAYIYVHVYNLSCCSLFIINSESFAQHILIILTTPALPKSKPPSISHIHQTMSPFFNHSRLFCVSQVFIFWICDLPLECGWLIRVTLLKKTICPSLDS